MQQATARTTLGLLLVALSTACESMPTSPNPFAPVRPPAPTPTIVAPKPAEEKPAEKPEEKGAAPSSAGGFDFEAEDRPEEKPGDRKVSASELYQGLGLGGAMPAVKSTPATPATPAFPPSPWPPPDGVASWGVRLLSTVADAQPPRAVLGLADGTERVVQPGALVPEARVVVLAIGRDAIQVAEVSPEGDHARVQTRLLQALYPGGAPVISQ